jgi:D-alanyl-D-alanine carboxypeptidase
VWAAGAMISTLEDLHIWSLAVATGKLLTPAMQRQRLETVDELDAPVRIGYGLGISNFAGSIGHNGTLPGYETVAVYLPEKQSTLVILVNTDIIYQGNEPSMTLAAAITKIISPDHIYAFSP